jgi:uncharacterized protein YyaL (SSP411 family)
VAEEDGPVPNRLAASTSPYLLQHQDNPVDWQPWGDEAFTEARERDVPVLLSIGYAACHWCHVISYVCLSAPRRQVHAQKLPFKRDHCFNVMARTCESSV